jgi:hypothetical protein
MILNVSFSVGDGVVYPLREDTSPERLDLLNERGKWMDESDEEGDNSYTYVETIDETQHPDRAIVGTPDVVTFN